MLASAAGAIGGSASAASAGCLTGERGDGTTASSGEEETLPSTSASEPSGETESTTGVGTDEEDGDATVATTSALPDVDFEASVESVEKCSRTCRTLTYALENRGTDAAPDVTVRIRVFTDGKKVWDEIQDVGTIDARSRRSGISRDVDVGILGGQKIKSNDGAVTIRLIPMAAGVSETFTFERTLDV